MHHGFIRFTQIYAQISPQRAKSRVVICGSIDLADFLNAPRKATKKPGRNEKVKVKYQDGEIVEKKYKYVERDLEAGECELVVEG